MRQIIRAFVFGAISVIVAPAYGDAASASRVLPEGQSLKDSRLSKIHDVDHPHDFAPDFADRAAWEKRREVVRDQVLLANGLLPLPEKTPLNPVIHGKIDRDDYTVEKVFFASMPGHYVSGNLYRPKNVPAGTKLAGVLCPHGHWPNGRFYERTEAEARKEIEGGGEKTIEGARYPLQARPAMLARMGCVVLFYDMVGYADSKPIEHRKGFTDADAELRGQSFMGLQTWNSIRALDFLLSLPEVDPNRIGVTGASGGGTQTMILGVVDDRVTADFPAVMVSANMQGGCICENASHLRVDTNNIEFASVFAPKPQAMTGANDWTRDIQTRGLPELKTIYKLYGAENAVNAKYFSYDHNYNQTSREMMYNWFNQHLKLAQKTPVTEKPFKPIPIKDLSVFDDQHPRPSDAAEAPALRKTMTESSDAQLKRLAESPEEFRKTISRALRVMIGDLPAKGEVVVSRPTGPTVGDSMRVEKGLLGRRGTGEQVPYVAIIPANWSGTVVVAADAKGKACLYDDSGELKNIVKDILAKGAAVASADLFATGEFPAFEQGGGKYSGQNYAGFLYGYNHSTFANRSRDLLSLISLVKNWEGTKQVHLVGMNKAGPWALLARAAAGDAVTRAAIDLHEFDFDQVKEATDEMMLPMARKYGGIWSFAALCTKGETVVFNAPATERPAIIAKTQGLSVETNPPSKEKLDWLVGK